MLLGFRKIIYLKKLVQIPRMPSLNHRLTYDKFSTNEKRPHNSTLLFLSCMEKFHQKFLVN